MSVTVGQVVEMPDAFMPYWDSNAPLKSDRLLELEFLRASGIPAELARHCSIWPAPFIRSDAANEGECVVLKVGGFVSPPRSIEELAGLKELRIGFDLELQPGFDLTSLTPILNWTPRLVVSGVELSGWEALNSASAVQSLGISATPADPLRLDMLPNLRYLNAKSPNAVYAASNPELTELVCTLTRWPRGAIVGPRVKRLTVWGGAAVNALPPMARPESLEALDIRSTSKFDLGSLEAAANLRELTLAKVVELNNFEALSLLPNLRKISFGGFKRIDGWEAMRNLTLDQLDLFDQSVLTEGDIASLRPR